MIPGPDRVIACPSCRGLETHLTLRSFTEWDVYRWTDGFSLCRSCPKPPPVVRCGHCGYVYWLRDAKVKGQLPRWGETEAPPEWQEAEHVVEPSEAEYYEALESGPGRNTGMKRISRALARWKSNKPLEPELGRTAGTERTARLLAWWKSNEALRGDIVTEIYSTWNISRMGRLREMKHEIGPWNPDPGARQANMENLLPLLDPRKGLVRIMRAELLRQLGRFDEALVTLQEVELEEASRAVDRIRTLCEEGDTLVRLLDDPDGQNRLEAVERALLRANPGQT